LSRSSEQNASASAVAQSMPWPDSIALRRLSRKRWIVRWTVKPSGSAVMRPPMSVSVAMSTPVLPRRSSSLSLPAGLMPAQRPSSQSAWLGR
jgi:hypothetical protein